MLHYIITYVSSHITLFFSTIMLSIRSSIWWIGWEIQNDLEFWVYNLPVGQSWKSLTLIVILLLVRSNKIRDILVFYADIFRRSYRRVVPDVTLWIWRELDNRILVCTRTRGLFRVFKVSKSMKVFENLKKYPTLLIYHYGLIHKKSFKLFSTVPYFVAV